LPPRHDARAEPLWKGASYAAIGGRPVRPGLIQLAGLLLIGVAIVSAQAPRTDTPARRVSARIQALQREAQQLAAQSRTLLGDLRQLEIERDLRTDEARQADAAAMAAQESLDTTTARVAALERERAAELPDMRAQLVDIYKRGRSGYASLIFGAADVREFARATRAVASLSKINQRRLDEHRATLAALRSERATQLQKAADLRNEQQRAEQAKAAAQRAIAARAALITRIDARRDLNAQYVGELQVAYDRLQQQVSSSAAGRVEVPLAPFRGALDWPVAGRVVGRFGQADRPGAGAVRNGVEIAVPEGTVVRAVHGGTVAFAGPFTGFGTLVIIDHGGNDFTLYGALGSVAVDRGTLVEAGTEMGRTGAGSGATPALYFEVRIDGRSVDPLQWLKPR
jgi:septal ring factor EnvC (AmiA/AmiB activator)